MRTCPECGQPFKPRRSDQGWCSATCNREAGHRELRRARALYRALYGWRLKRRSSAQDLGFVCREVASWIDEDRAEGRAPPPPHNHSADRGHLRRRSAARYLPSLANSPAVTPGESQTGAEAQMGTSLAGPQRGAPGASLEQVPKASRTMEIR
jgi:hypothetical protein